MIARLLRSADFERVLRTPVRARSVHFAAHHVVDLPSVPQKAAKQAFQAKLSTTDLLTQVQPVDESAVAGPTGAPAGALWLGAVIPKRHARRAVTRTLLKRQIRAAVAGQAAGMPAGLWVIRLRAPFDVKQFPSARSEVLREAARNELQQLLAGALQRGRAR